MVMPLLSFYEAGQRCQVLSLDEFFAKRKFSPTQVQGVFECLSSNGWVLICFKDHPPTVARLYERGDEQRDTLTVIKEVVGSMGFTMEEQQALLGEYDTK